MAAPPGMAARVDNQGDSSTCTRFALAKAVVECLDDMGIDIEQGEVKTYLVNLGSQTVAEGKFATDFDKAGMRFQDPTSLSWHFLTMAIKQTSLDDFKTAAVHKMSSSFLKDLIGLAPKALCTKGVKHVLNWTTSDPPPHNSHCLYAKGWDRRAGTVFCLNSWGETDPELHIRPGSISRIYSVSLVVQASEGGHIEAVSAFPGLKPYKMTPEALKMCTDLGVTFTEEPLSSPQADFKGKYGSTISEALLVHKMAVEGEVAALRRRSAELTPALLDSVCKMRIITTYTEVTPLYLACFHSQSDAAALLLHLGADPNIAATRTSGGSTSQFSPLYWAAVSGDASLVRRLVERGARNSLGGSPLSVARLTEEIRIILQANVNL